MRQFERSGVTVDQCLECRGIFLDRGELERLIDAENTYNQNLYNQPPVPSPPSRVMNLPGFLRAISYRSRPRR